jgi:hypothetical protein
MSISYRIGWRVGAGLESQELRQKRQDVDEIAMWRAISLTLAITVLASG